MGFIQKSFFARQFPFIMLTAAVVVWFLCLNLFQDGMFIDGIQYAAVARNLARGVGTFWNPVLAQNSVAGLNSFHEHPPLAFFIQSLFFKIFGMNNIYPERIYCLFTFLSTGLFMALIWRNFFKESVTKQLWWLPVLMWAIMPIVFWAYTNDIQENTMGVFTTAAVYFFMRAIKSAAPVLRTPAFYIGCLSIFLAFFCKGVPGLFPVTFFFVYWLTLRKTSFVAALIYSFSIIGLLAICLYIILQNETARQTLHTWFFDRMLHRISADPTENSHFYILLGLLTEQLPAIILAALALAIYRYKHIKNQIDKGSFKLFLLLGFTASLPLMLTLVQRNFYFIPALPMFAIAWALLIADGAQRGIDYLGNHRIYIRLFTAFVCIALIAGVITTLAFAGKIKRDKEVLQDVYTIKKAVPDNSFVSVTSNIMWLDWSFRCYMMRYDEVSFSDKDTCTFFIAKAGDKINDRFIKTDVPLNMYILYKRK